VRIRRRKAKGGRRKGLKEAEGHETTPCPPSLTALLRHLFFQAYDHLGSLIVLNVVWAALSLPWFFVSGVLLALAPVYVKAGRADIGAALGGAAVCIGLVSPPTAGLLRGVRERDLSIGGRVRVVLRDFRRRFWTAQVTGLLLAGAVCLLGVNLRYYASLKGLWKPVGWGLLGVVFGTCLGLMTVAPMWVVGAAQTGRVREGFLVAVGLALSRPGPCFGASAVTGLLLLAGAATGVGLFTGAASVAGLWAVLCHEALSAARDGLGYDLSASRRLRELWRPWENKS
jgi:uncharacterized membrane protein YesL